MSVRAGVLLLFLAAFVALPLPLLGLAGSLVPAARYVQHAAVMVGLVSVEGAGGMVGTLVGLFVVHAAVYTLALAGLAWATGRLVLVRLEAPGRRILVVALVVILLVSGSFGSLYQTQFHDRSAHARLLELYR